MRLKLLKWLAVVAIALLLLFFCARQQSRTLVRDPEVLLNKYYLFREKNPEEAKKALLIILKQSADNIPALRELSQFYISQNQPEKALPYLQHLHQLLNNDQHISLELANHYFEMGDWQQSSQILEELKGFADLKTRIEAQKSLNQMASYVPYFHSNAQESVPIIAPQESTPYMATLLHNLYYQRQKQNPDGNEDLLQLIHLLDPDNNVVLQELGYEALRHSQNEQAIEFFSAAYQQKPNESLALQLAYLYFNEHDNKQAAHYFLLAARSSDPKIKENALRAYAYVTQPESQSVLAGNTSIQNINPPKAMSREQILMDHFYALKRANSASSWPLIQEIIKAYPMNELALKEGGYLAIDKKQRFVAIEYFTRAFDISHDPLLAMQLAYLYDYEIPSINKYMSYEFFKYATKSPDKELALRAQNSMTNLSGQQTKFLLPPYFSEVFFDPFSQSRFGLTVRPLIIRAGLEEFNKWQTKQYAYFRRTDDNKSASLGQIPQIYEDNVQILGIGFQVTPIPQIPIVAFAEGGGAYDLIYRNRERWRGDIRGGLMYYQEFGARPAYFDKWTVKPKYYSYAYADSIYFSRYKNNVISSVRTHQGVRAAQYRSTMLNLYVAGHAIVDTRREFFNNIAEIGPGIGFIPSNRYKVEIRFEALRGMYLPVGGSSFNPYGKYYSNRIVQLFFYVKM